MKPETQIPCPSQFSCLGIQCLVQGCNPSRRCSHIQNLACQHVHAGTAAPGHLGKPSAKAFLEVCLAQACGTSRASRIWNSRTACWPRGRPSTWWSPALSWGAWGNLASPSPAAHLAHSEPPFQSESLSSHYGWGHCARRSPARRQTPYCVRSVASG